MKSNKSNTIGERIYDLRENKRKVSQQCLADELGIKRQIVSYWETDGRKPDIEMVIKLSEHLDTTCDYILRGIAPKNSTQNFELGLKNDSIEVLKRAAEIIRKEKNGEDWRELDFVELNKRGKYYEKRRHDINLSIAKNIIDCINLLLGETISTDADCVLDALMSYISSSISEDDEYDLIREDGIFEKETILGSEVLAAKFIIIQQALIKLRENLKESKFLKIKNV